MMKTLELLLLVLAGGCHSQVPELALPDQPRLLVFAPHPDDETLATGGLIQRALERGGRVRIVFLTSGDGYPEAVRHETGHRRPTKRDFVAFGMTRVQEAQAAAGVLGVAQKRLVFLGFPDGGVATLWSADWSERHPFTSPFTGEDHPPAGEAMGLRVDYSGADLDREVRRVLERFRPTVVAVPLPSERHPDHCATGLFVLRALRAGTVQPLPQMLGYIVHAYAWPPGRSSDWSTPLPAPTDAVPAGAQWVELRLTPTEFARKTEALQCHKTQLDTMRDFLERFLRPNELFAQLVPRGLANLETTQCGESLR